MKTEVIAFIVYFAIVLGVGIWFFLKSRKHNGEKEYFLGGRGMNGAVAALSAGASDMSAWVLMGLPGAIYFYGLGQIWISVGLFIGTALAWIFVAPRLRTFSIKANDSITIPQFLKNRFMTEDISLQIICAVVFLVAYCIYTASSISACGDLFQNVFNLSSTGRQWTMIVAAAVIVVYTFLGGFNAVCWTDFFQGLLMLAALMAAPIVAMFMINGADFVAPVLTEKKHFYSLLSTGKWDTESIVTILTGLGWGLGYFGMPHILVRYMSIKSKKEMKRSQIIGTSWTFLILVMATVVALVGRNYLGDILDKGSEQMIFIKLVPAVFPGILAGVLLSAILAASMSTADSQLLASSSAAASDIFKPLSKKATDKQVAWVGKLVVIAICAVAAVIAIAGNKSIMDLVSTAWSGFGSAFGPVILLALYWKKFNYKGAIAGIVSGFVVNYGWLYGIAPVLAKSETKWVAALGGLYEIIPGFLVCLIVSILVTVLTGASDRKVRDWFDEAVEFTKNEQ